MFIQVIQGHVSDTDEIRAALDRWEQTVAPGAIGYLGSTSGVADDGTFITLARFESPEAARRNSDRPQQHDWWMETAKLFSGDVTFHDCTEVVTFGQGGSDDAGFVQVMQGRVRDVDRWRELNERYESVGGDSFRPDVIGGVVAMHGDGGYTNAVYFTSEAEARENEKKEAPPEMKQLMEEEMALHEGDITFIDLNEPWLRSPG